jgi:acetyl-CoA synthetase
VDEKGNSKEQRVLTYFDFWRLVNRIAFALRRLGVRRGSRVAIYMPMIPELPGPSTRR